MQSGRIASLVLQAILMFHDTFTPPYPSLVRMLTHVAYTCTCILQDAIITSLQAYNSHIDTLKEEMDEATGSAEEIRKEIHGFRNK